MSSIPAAQTVQFYSRDGTTVAVAATPSQKGAHSSASPGGTTAVTEAVVPVTTAASFQLNADTLQLIGMSGTLPNSNLFVNYPHTKWERDAEGNMVPIQVTSIVSEAGGVGKQEGEGDALSQAAAVIKSEIPNSSLKSGSSITKSFICSICSKGFAKREHLTKHTRIHKEAKRYTCEFCQKMFRDRYELVRHSRRHTGDFPFRCGDCNKGFMRHERYMTHLRWHSGERPFQCSMCDKSFRDRSELNRHARRHTGDLPYKCSTCSKGFLRRERYITHVRIHTGEKPFVCGVCSRGYRDKRELKKHQITHNHVDSNPDSPPPPMVVASASGGPPPAAQQLTFVTPASVSATRQTAGLGSITAVAVSPIKAVTTSAAHPAMTVVSSHQPQNSSMATITFSLPTEPVPKNQLGLAPDPPQHVYAPLNPAQIQLPPSVAAALQNMNSKVVSNKHAMATSSPAGIVLAAAPTTPVKQEASIAHLAGGHVIKQFQGATAFDAGDGNQITLAAGSFPGLISGGGPQVFYYVMPNTMQPLMAESQTALRTTTGADGGTTQFLALPAGALQATVPVSSVNGTFPQWIIDSNSIQASGSTGGRTNTM
jgi:hypothetical protein